MRIGHIAPINFNIPNGRSGPTRVFVDLNEEMYKLNPDLTVFACQNSRVSGQLEYLFPQELNALPEFAQADRKKIGLFYLKHIVNAYRHREKINIFLSHYDRWGLPVASLITDRPTVIVVHNVSQDLLRDLEQFNDRQIHFVCLSYALGEIFRRQADNFTVIHNGIDVAAIKPQERKEDFFLFVGRLVESKGADLAIAACLKTQRRLVVIGQPIVETAADTEYFHRKVEPFLTHPLIQHIPNISHDQIFDYYRRASALIFPLRDYTAEGMPIIIPESLACGTPVISLANPLSQELIKPGQTGLLAATPADLAACLSQARAIKAQDCRREAEREFSREVMARRYYELLSRLAK